MTVFSMGRMALVGAASAGAVLGGWARPALGDLSVVKTSDSIVDSEALLFPDGSTYGRAINGQSFQAEALISQDGYQYTAWYRHDAQKSVMIARRSVSGSDVGAWDVVDTGSALTLGDNDWDIHNTISIGIAANDGTVHLSWDHHNSALKYRVSQAGVATDHKEAWGPGMFSPTQSDLLGTAVGNITYPAFFNTPSGDLQMAYRVGGSGDGDYVLSTYEGGAWSPPKMFIGTTGTYGTGQTSRNGYPNSFEYGPDGKLHATWVWRESAGGSNHDISYAYSEDGGVTWKNNAGAVVGNTAVDDRLLISDPGLVVDSIGLKETLYNTFGEAVDLNGGVHTVVVYRRDEPEHAWHSGDPHWDPEDAAYYHYYRDPVSGEWSIQRLPVETGVGARPAVGVDAEGNVFAVYTDRGPEDGNYKYNAGNLVIAGATAASGYSDWTVLHMEATEFIGEPLIDQRRLVEDGILSIVIQENSDATGVTGTNLHVLEFTVPEPGSAAVIVPMALAVLARRRGRG